MHALLAFRGCFAAKTTSHVNSAPFSTSRLFRLPTFFLSFEPAASVILTAAFVYVDCLFQISAVHLDSSCDASECSCQYRDRFCQVQIQSRLSTVFCFHDGIENGKAKFELAHESPTVSW